MAEPIRDGKGATVLGPRNPEREQQNPDLLTPPFIDHGSMPNLRFSFADAHMRLEDGGWSREVTARELPSAITMAGVNMRLDAGGVREMHWHKQAEWAYMIAGQARITAVDEEGRNFAADVGTGDLWYFPAGIPHSIQGLAPDGCEFLLAFPNGQFSEESTFLLSDLFAHTPKSVLAKNFGVPESAFAAIPVQERFIFRTDMPGPLASDRVPDSQGIVPRDLTFRLMQQEPIHSETGWVRIADSRDFVVSTEVAAALVELAPGGLREIHWHPNADEWQYYVSGAGRMTVFGAEGRARTFDYQAGDVGVVPRSMSHFIENTGPEPLRFLELFRGPKYADVSLHQWLALTPPELVRAHLNLDGTTVAALHKRKRPVI